VWPDLRLRDTVLRAGQLSALTGPWPEGGVATVNEQRKAILDDEIRSFTLAISRARRYLYVTAVESAEQQPSVLFNLLKGTDNQVISKAPPPLDLRGLVASLRHDLISLSANEKPDRPVEGEVLAEMQNNARLLAALAALDLPGADPDDWSGLATLTATVPLFSGEETVTLSPSKLDTLLTCPLRWALERCGARQSASSAQDLGSLLHQLAEAAVQLIPEQPNHWQQILRQRFAEQWPPQTPTNWVQQRQAAEATAKLERLITYLSQHPVALAAEAPIDTTIGQVRLRGSIDRVEPVSAQAAADHQPSEPVKVVVVDLKSGKTPISATSAETNGQLGAYQAAVNAGALNQQLGHQVEAVGANLVYLGLGTTGPAQRHQAAMLPGDSWFTNALNQAGQTAQSASFLAIANPGCPNCPALTSCPIGSTTGQVTT
jgi:RecB family exonuclease